MARKLDAIVVLGGSLKKEGNKWRTTNFNESDEFGCLGDRLRVVAGRYLYQDYQKFNPNLLVVASGGRGQLEKIKGTPTLAEVLRQELAALGVSSDKIILESKSANTYQQLRELAKLSVKSRFQKIVIISNQYHLPRIKAMIEYSGGLKILQRKLSGKNLVLESAEKNVLRHNRSAWQGIIERAYKSEQMESRVKLEKQGVEQIKSGTYQF